MVFSILACLFLCWVVNRKQMASSEDQFCDKSSKMASAGSFCTWATMERIPTMAMKAAMAAGENSITWNTEQNQ